jgi:hypothetical protein
MTRGAGRSMAGNRRQASLARDGRRPRAGIGSNALTPSPNLEPGLVRESSVLDAAPNLVPAELLAMQGR